jgi:hypothetical protein
MVVTSESRGSGVLVGARAVALGAGIATFAFAGQASAASPGQAVASLNAQRVANGIPAGIVERSDLDTGCAHHDAYERANGGQLTHTEDPMNPGYTDDGAAAAQHSVLSQGATWDSSNPWEHAPIHLAQLLAPRLDATGVDDSGGFTCAQTLASRDRPAPPGSVTYTYPGDGTATIYPSEVAAEGPYTPGEQVGISAGSTTGPYLYVFFDGPWSAFASAQITSASLRGPDGPVAIKTVDDTTSGLTGYIPTGGMIIPLAALVAGATYTAQVAATVTDSGGGSPQGVAHTWSFMTAASGSSGAPGGAGGGAGGPTRRRGCRVPSLRGLTVNSARARLRHAGCRLGVVTRLPRRRARRTPRIVSQRPRPGSRGVSGERVAVSVRG